MDGARGQLLARPRFPLEQHGRAGGCGGGDHVQQLPDLRRVADDLALVPEGHHLAAQRLVLPAESRQLEGRGDGDLELVGAHGLRDVVHGAGLDRRDRVLDRSMPGEHDHGHLGPFLAQVFEELESGHARHPLVEDDEVEGLALEHTERLRDVRGPKGLVPHPEERVVEDRADRRVVVDVEDLGHAGSRLARMIKCGVGVPTLNSWTCSRAGRSPVAAVVRDKDSPSHTSRHSGSRSRCRYSGRTAEATQCAARGRCWHPVRRREMTIVQTRGSRRRPGAAAGRGRGRDAGAATEPGGPGCSRGRDVPVPP